MLRALGFSAIPLHGQMSLNVRLASLAKFRGKARNLLIATDMAARGLNIASVDLVLNYDLPGDSKTYIHCVGRTARARRSGVVMSLVTQYDVEVWLRIEEALGKKSDKLKILKDKVMVFAKRVGVAQRVAAVGMRNLQDKRGNLGSTLRGKKRGMISRELTLLSTRFGFRSVQGGQHFPTPSRAFVLRIVNSNSAKPSDSSSAMSCNRSV